MLKLVSLSKVKWWWHVVVIGTYFLIAPISPPHTPDTPSEPDRSIASTDDPIMIRSRVIEPERFVVDIHHKSKEEEVVKLKKARIVLVDYDLIRRDFPHIKTLSEFFWIVDQQT